jgi:hypothetical protein
MIYSESSGQTQIDDLLTDINAINLVAKKRFGYPTQEPETHLGHILKTSSNEGNLFLDHFCA